MSSKTEKTIDDKSGKAETISSVNGTVIRASIIAIDTIITQTTGPCSKAFCKAFVRIEDVLRRNSSMGDIIYKGMEVNVNFAFTLGVAKDFFPEADIQLTGLQINDIFEAQMESFPDDEGNFTHSILLYKRIEN